MKIPFKHRLKILFTGNLSDLCYSKTVEPIKERRIYSIWYNPEDKWFEVFDHNNETICLLRDVEIRDDYKNSKDIPVNKRQLLCRMDFLGVMVQERPVPNVPNVVPEKYFIVTSTKELTDFQKCLNKYLNNDNPPHTTT